MPVIEYVLTLLQGGAGNLAAYLAAHVLLCLLPAFFVAGALTALVPKEAVTRYLGPKAPKFISYPAAAVGGFVLAVCSCTIMPLFAGIYKKGAGLGPAITFLFVGPAINILALSYTGVALGMDIAIARVVLSAVFGVGIGLIMALAFRKSDRERLSDGTFDGKARVPGRTWLMLGLLLALLVSGTLQVSLLTDSVAEISMPWAGAQPLQNTLDRLVPYDASQGQEGVTVQGLFLIVMLIVIGVTAWFGLNKIDEGFSRWTWVALGAIAVTLLFAALSVSVTATGLVIGLRGKLFAVAVLMAAIGIVAAKAYDTWDVQEWLWETWRFVKQIFPLLIVGVFTVGMLRYLIRPEWIEALAGSNTVLANFVGVVFGVFMYFPTLVEVPIANMFLSLGMHRGPLLAYLMSDPELSLQSILITSSVIGKTKAWVYVGLVAVFSTLAGLVYGAWYDGQNIVMLALAVGLGLCALAAILWFVGRRNASVSATESSVA